jgi:3'(2'), 5'-bisphosphate nucleotidase
MTQRISRELLLGVVNLAVEAGDAIMTIYKTDFSVDYKADESPLTAADMAAHRVIEAGLNALEPKHPVLSEESADSVPFETRRDWSSYWLVDPLDGTKEFVKKNGEFTVNIALIDGERAILGVVHVPARNETYYAAEGLGAFKRENGAERAIAVEHPAARPVRVAGSRSHGNEETQRFIERLGESEVVAIGSALKLCLVAEGAVDVYPRFGLTSEWDTGAAQAVVEQAGGRVTTMDLKTLTYNTKESLLNPHFLVFGDTSVDWTAYMD